VPFFVAMLAMIVLVVAVPELITWLPDQMLGTR
jgi:TRAP-type C4-dicarboxylate transport system permease large subunit